MTSNKLNSWILASRPKTLPASVSPVIVGTALAVYNDAFDAIAALLAVFCALLIQIATNFTNDLYDFLAGTDTTERVGPKRALAEGWITVSEMKTAIILTFGAAFLAGLFLVYTGGFWVLVIGVLSILAGLAYTAGPYPLAYNGLGDIFVFIFFGLVATVGTYYVQAHSVASIAVVSSLPMGALITNILIVNNYRDLEDDKLAGKKTMAVLYGAAFTRFEYLFLLIVCYTVPFIIFFFYDASITVLMPLLSLPVAIRLFAMLFTHKGEQLNQTLEYSGKLTLVYALLFSLGLFL
ncbi:MAG: 1,4-dihydroxy-2-naphthoate polyprenyltransferase [Bacteroidota bacterium]